MSRRGRRSGWNAGIISIAVIVVAFLIIIEVQIHHLKQKVEQKDARLEALQQQYEDETQRAAELEELENYMKSDAYIEETAKSKLGLVYDSEIIFKESEE